VARGRERASSLGLGSFGCGAWTVLLESAESSDRDDFADSLRAEAGGCVSRGEGVSLKGEPVSPLLLKIHRRLLRSATSTWNARELARFEPPDRAFAVPFTRVTSDGAPKTKVSIKQAPAAAPMPILSA